MFFSEICEIFKNTYYDYFCISVLLRKNIFLWLLLFKSIF